MIVEALLVCFVTILLMEKFGAQGFPNTFVIDENGLVRIEQLGGGAGISRFLAADLEGCVPPAPMKLCQRKLDDDSSSLPWES
jgi:hypothetical protein